MSIQHAHAERGEDPQDCPDCRKDTDDGGIDAGDPADEIDPSEWDDDWGDDDGGQADFAERNFLNGEGDLSGHVYVENMSGYADGSEP